MVCFGQSLVPRYLPRPQNLDALIRGVQIMRRWFYVSVMSFALLLTAILVTSAVSESNAADKSRGKQPKQKKESNAEFAVKVEAWGPSQEEIDKTVESITRDAAVQQFLNGTQNRLISFEYIDPDNKKGDERPPDRYGDVYDYTNERAIVALGSFAKPELCRLPRHCDSRCRVRKNSKPQSRFSERPAAWSHFA